MAPDDLRPAQLEEADEALRQLSHRSVFAEPQLASLQAFLDRVRAVLHADAFPPAEAADDAEVSRQRYLDIIWQYARASLQYARGGRRWTHVLDPRLHRGERERVADPFIGIRVHPPSHTLRPSPHFGRHLRVSVHVPRTHWRKNPGGVGWKEDAIPDPSLSMGEFTGDAAHTSIPAKLLLAIDGKPDTPAGQAATGYIGSSIILPAEHVRSLVHQLMQDPPFAVQVLGRFFPGEIAEERHLIPDVKTAGVEVK